MRLNSLLSSRQPWVRHNADDSQLTRALSRLSSGLRVNSAADDASGLSIATKMGAQIRGLNRSIQNISESIGWVQTTEGALQEVSALLQRGRELSVQAANDSLGGDDRTAIQSEITQILSEVHRISEASEYNGKKIFDTSAVSRSNPLEFAITENLKRSWLREGEKLVRDMYGLEADGADFEIAFVNAGGGSYSAAVSSTATGVRLDINLDIWTSTNWPDGDVSGPANYQDRTIAHEMVHAVMFRDLNVVGVPTWFMEGTAEFITGADERLKSRIAATDIATVAGDVADGTWTSDSQHYAGAYAATRFLHAEIKAQGHAGGIKDLLADMDDGGMTLDQAIANRTTYANEAAFRAAFGGAGVGQGQAFIGTMDLDNADTGAIGGLDADGLAVKTAESVVPDIDSYSNDPLSNFVEKYPNSGLVSASRPDPFKMQVGSGAGDTMDLALINVSTKALGIEDLDVTRMASTAITKFDDAINQVARARSRLGAVQNRLQHALSVNQINTESTQSSQSRIQDADFAKEVVSMTRSQILQQASTAIMAQTQDLARGHYQSVMSLLR